MQITFKDWSSQWHLSLIPGGSDYKVGVVVAKGRKKEQTMTLDAVKGCKDLIKRTDWYVEVMKDGKCIAWGKGDTETEAENDARTSLETYIRKHGWGRRA